MAAVVYLDDVASLAQPLVLQRGEPLAPLLDQLLPGLLVVQLAGFFAQAIRCEAARGQQDMGMVVGENTENGKNRTLRLWHVRRSRAVLGLSVAVSGWSTAQPGVRRSGERASE